MKPSIDLSLFKFSYQIHARWSDMDELHHINNAVYLSYLEDARGRYLHFAADWDWMVDGIILANLNINYQSPMHFLNEAKVYVRCSKVGNKSFELQYIVAGINNQKEEVVFASAESTQVMFDYKSNTSVLIPDHLRVKLNSFDSQDTFIKA
jgi:acyl-CoA thioester hydrolase